MLAESGVDAGVLLLAASGWFAFWACYLWARVRQRRLALALFAALQRGPRRRR